MSVSQSDEKFFRFALVRRLASAVVVEPPRRFAHHRAPPT
jgi:hypothetical protein